MIRPGCPTAYASLILFLLLTPILSGQEYTTVGKNLIENSSFEELDQGKPTGWNQQTWSGAPVFELENEFSHSGKNCVRLRSDEGADASWSFTASVKPNTRYRLSAWIKTEDIAKDGFGVQLNLHQLQMEGKSKPLRGSNDWTQITTEFNSGQHRELLVNCLFGGWGRATGTAWFDDIELYQLEKKVVIPQMSESEAEAFFQHKVLPVLKSKCFDCHGGKKIRADLVLTNRADLIAGGESGESIDLEHPLDSLLLDAINYETYEMPPSGKLPKEDIENITKWVLMGAPWKGEGFKSEVESESHSVPTVNAETKKWWSYQPRHPVTPPQQSSPWVSNEIDQFIFQRLKEKSLTPNPIASKQALVRRAYYDLTGLPPTPEDVQEFVSDRSEDAYEKLIDRLLESKHYGEKWGRHWLDLVRYGESNSYERDGTKPFVWKYRDYVIRSLNDDKPYNQFLVEQLAGDELETESPDALIATGYYRLGKWDDEPVDREQAWFDDMDDVLKTTSQAMLGMTVDCARCHDHKIDPVPQADYYRMLAFFGNVQRYGIRGHDTVLRQSSRPIVSREVQSQHAEAVAKHRKAVADNQKALAAIESRVKPDFIPVEHEEFKHEMNRVPLVKKRVGTKLGESHFTQSDADQYAQLFDEMKRLRREPPKALEACLCVTETGKKKPREMFVMIRGNAHAPAEQVSPGFPSVLSPPEPEIVAPSDGESLGRRLALAHWIAADNNPLTARVMVNRIWQHHFGRGIVRSANDFGFQGTPPTHPELLDWLANDFVQGGWKLKRLHKSIMLSSTYRMSSKAQPAGLSADPTNDLFWRFNMRRLTAEEVRDSILAVNHTLNREKMYGPSIYPIIPREVLHGQSRPGENWGKSSPEDLARRSIYIHIKRSLPVPMMASFDVADPDTSCPVRFNTVQPTQALGMLNSEFINRQATTFAEWVLGSQLESKREQVKLILARVLQRNPKESEINKGLEFLNRMKSLGHDDKKSLSLFCVIALNLNEFLYLD